MKPRSYPEMRLVRLGVMCVQRIHANNIGGPMAKQKEAAAFFWGAYCVAIVQNDGNLAMKLLNLHNMIEGEGFDVIVNLSMGRPVFDVTFSMNPEA